MLRVAWLCPGMTRVRKFSVLWDPWSTLLPHSPYFLITTLTQRRADLRLTQLRMLQSGTPGSIRSALGLFSGDTHPLSKFFSKDSWPWSCKEPGLPGCETNRECVSQEGLVATPVLCHPVSAIQPVTRSPGLCLGRARDSPGKTSNTHDSRPTTPVVFLGIKRYTVYR